MENKSPIIYVEKITKKYISLYDYNLFNVRSTYKIPVNEIKV